MKSTTEPGNNLAVIILTLNEEANLPQALASVAGWAHEVVVVDSGSQDRTREIAGEQGARVVVHPFQGYAAQRNFALHQAGIESEWVLFLDADEWLEPEIKEEISRVLATAPLENGFYLRRRFIWMGRWLKRGYYPVWLLRLMRREHARCEERAVNEHLVVEGGSGRIERGDLVHEDRKGIPDWVRKHLRYAGLEAQELLRRDRGDQGSQAPPRLLGSQAERKRWIRQRVWERMPPLVRPLPYFAYRYLLKGGFLEGREALAYHLLQGLWFPLLIDLLYLEQRAGAPDRERP